MRTITRGASASSDMSENWFKNNRYSLQAECFVKVVGNVKPINLYLLREARKYMIDELYAQSLLIVTE